jgi:hypothetical protein
VGADGNCSNPNFLAEVLNFEIQPISYFWAAIRSFLEVPANKMALQQLGHNTMGLISEVNLDHLHDGC